MLEVVNDTKENKDTNATKVTDLPMELKDIIPMASPANTVKNVYATGSRQYEGGDILAFIDRPSGIWRYDMNVILKYLTVY